MKIYICVEKLLGSDKHMHMYLCAQYHKPINFIKHGKLYLPVVYRSYTDYHSCKAQKITLQETHVTWEMKLLESI
jgi:hypothetical protein